MTLYNKTNKQTLRAELNFMLWDRTNFCYPAPECAHVYLYSQIVNNGKCASNKTYHFNLIQVFCVATVALIFCKNATLKSRNTWSTDSFVHRQLHHNDDDDEMLYKQI